VGWVAEIRSAAFFVNRFAWVGRGRGGKPPGRSIMLPEGVCWHDSCSFGRGPSRYPARSKTASRDFVPRPSQKEHSNGRAAETDWVEVVTPCLGRPPIMSQLLVWCKYRVLAMDQTVHGAGQAGRLGKVAGRRSSPSASRARLCLSSEPRPAGRWRRRVGKAKGPKVGRAPYPRR
jgi:hypothetical protein